MKYPMKTTTKTNPNKQTEKKGARMKEEWTLGYFKEESSLPGRAGRAILKRVLRSKTELKQQWKYLFKELKIWSDWCLYKIIIKDILKAV